jgi:HEAT repeat protein
VRASTTSTTEVRVQACSTLARLHSPHAIPALVEALQDREEPVRKAAWQALVELTGAEHPPESEAWLALAES